MCLCVYGCVNRTWNYINIKGCYAFKPNNLTLPCNLYLIFFFLFMLSSSTFTFIFSYASFSRLSTLSCFPSYFKGLYNSLTASLQRSKTTPNECPRYDINQSDSEIPALEIWRILSTSSLPLLLGPLLLGVVVSHWIPSNRTVCLF